MEGGKNTLFQISFLELKKRNNDIRTYPSAATQYCLFVQKNCSKNTPVGVF